MLALSVLLFGGCQATNNDDDFVMLELSEMQSQIGELQQKLNAVESIAYGVDSTVFDLLEIKSGDIEANGLTISKSIEPCSSGFLVDDNQLFTISGTSAKMYSEDMDAVCCCTEEFKSSVMCLCEYK